MQAKILISQRGNFNYRIAGKFGEFTRFEHLAKKVWRMNRFSQKVIIVSRNLDGFSLANQG